MEPRERSRSFVVRIWGPASQGMHGRWRGYVEEVDTRVRASFITFDELVAFLMRRTGARDTGQGRIEGARRWLRRFSSRALEHLSGRGRR